MLPPRMLAMCTAPRASFPLSVFVFPEETALKHSPFTTGTFKRRDSSSRVFTRAPPTCNSGQDVELLEMGGKWGWEIWGWRWDFGIRVLELGVGYKTRRSGVEVKEVGSRVGDGIGQR